MKHPKRFVAPFCYAFICWLTGYSQASLGLMNQCRGRSLLLAFVCSVMVGFFQIPVFGVEISTGPAAGSTNDVLCVMTLNLRYASDRPPNAWPQRRPVMKDCILEIKPDLIGTQEGVYAQLKDLHQDLHGYEWIGLGRDGGSKGEFMAVFYRRDRFEPLEYDHFWLSDTPEVMASSTWGNSNRRMVTWVRFQDKRTNRQFYFWNTHLDHALQPAREKGAELILNRLQNLNAELPLLLVGDFNATAGTNKVFHLLVNTNAFQDTWTLAKSKRGEIVKTFHNFRGPVAGDNRIDWILARGKVEVDATQIITFSREGQFPSDHFPVVAWLRFR